MSSAATTSTTTKDVSNNSVPTKDSTNQKAVSTAPYPNTKTSSIQQPGTSIRDHSANQNTNNSLNESLQYSSNQSESQDLRRKQLYNLPQAQDYCADDSCSSIQNTKPANKAGWCFIGTDKGFRSCAYVSETDKCMSGEIFPSQQVRVNPSLR
jgi:hypothetical protein